MHPIDKLKNRQKSKKFMPPAKQPAPMPSGMPPMAGGPPMAMPPKRPMFGK